MPRAGDLFDKFGARKASEIVILTCRTLHSSRVQSSVMLVTRPPQLAIFFAGVRRRDPVEDGSMRRPSGFRALPVVDLARTPAHHSSRSSKNSCLSLPGMGAA
jgi:hypothetical protein